MSTIGQIYRWSLSHGKGDKHCTLLIINDDGRFNNIQCLVIDGNHVLGYGDVFPGQSVKIYNGWYYFNQMKRLM